jgi:cell division protein FtsN
MARTSGKNPFFSGFFVGLFAGLALAVIVALLVTRNNPFVEQTPGSGASASAPAAPVEAPKYEFYQTLPEGQAGSAPAATATATTAYFLQAGAFGNAADAEEMKARLALLGFEAKTLTTQEGETLLHKVRIGPYKSLDELNTVRARLTQGGVETMLVRIGPKQEDKQ